MNNSALHLGITRIISGGQTGADQGGLLAGRDLGIETGGWAPRGYRTEEGPAAWLVDFNVFPMQSNSYVERTRENIKLSDGTVIFGKASGGSLETEFYCQRLGKPVVWVKKTYLDDPLASHAIDLMLSVWIKTLKIKTLNVAGNRESVYPGIKEKVREVLVRVLTA